MCRTLKLARTQHCFWVVALRTLSHSLTALQWESIVHSTSCVRRCGGCIVVDSAPAEGASLTVKEWDKRRRGLALHPSQRGERKSSLHGELFVLGGRAVDNGVASAVLHASGGKNYISLCSSFRTGSCPISSKTNLTCRCACCEVHMQPLLVAAFSNASSAD